MNNSAMSQGTKIIAYKQSKNNAKKIPFTIVLKRLKCSGRKLTKEGQDMYTENGKMLLREIREDWSKWRDKPGFQDSVLSRWQSFQN
jgi:hypothetical protein